MEVKRVTVEEAPEPAKEPRVVTGTQESPEETQGELIEHSDLEDWEVQHGKYGIEYLGIKNIAETFPLKMQFAQLDKYIKSEIKERGYDLSRESWQNVLKEIEGEIGTDKLDAYERLKRISEYLKVVQKLRDLEKKKKLLQV